MRAAVLALVVLGSMASMAAASDFSECVCWDTAKNEWCGGGGDFWSRSSCNNYITNTFAWTIPAIVLVFTFLFFPFIFLCARCCCNCCGGREPSKGCCCPSKDYEAGPDGTPRVAPKKYSNKSIFVTKLLFAFCCGYWIYTSVGIFVINDSVHWSVLHTVNNLQSNLDNLGSEISTTVDYMTEVNQQPGGATIVPPDTLLRMESVESNFESVHHKISNVLLNITHLECNSWYGRDENAYRIPSWPMCFILIGIFMMFCNCKGPVLTVSAGLFSLLAVFVGIIFIIHAVLAQTSHAVCDNYNTSFVPTLVGVIESNDGCGKADVVAQLNSGAQQYISQACTSGFMALCGNYFNCPAGYKMVCDPAFSDYVTGATLINETLMQAVSLPTAGCDQCSITQCATQCQTPNAQQEAQSFLSFMNMFGTPMTYVLTTSYPDYVNCSGISTRLKSNAIRGELCFTFETKFTNIAIQFLTLFCLCIPLVILFILAAKRFQKMRKANGEEAEIVSPQQFVYGVLLNQEDQATLGSPLMGNHPRPDQVYGTALYTDNASLQTMEPERGAEQQGVIAATPITTCAQKVDP